MRTRTRGRAWLLSLVLAAAPGMAFAQSDGTGYALPDAVLPLPIGNTHPGIGGPYLDASYVMYRMSNPMKQQVIGVRGFQVVDDSLLGPGTAGTFVGTRNDALDTHQISGPNGYQPGFDIGAGYQFRDGSTLEADFLWISEAQNRAVATPAPRNLAIGPTQADSFLTAFVFNFPPEYAGPAFKVGNPPPNTLATPFVTYGIWDGAATMTEVFLRRFEQFQITYRVPVFQTETYRISGLVGPRFTWFDDKFIWRTVAQDSFGNEQPNWAAIYNNNVSNRMYGLFIGCSNEWYIGGGVAAMVNLAVAGFFDSVKESVSYELDRGAGDLPANKRALREIQFVPELQGTFGLMWYPYEGIQIMAGYNVMAFFNTIASPHPVSFDYSGLNPKFESTARFLDGFQLGAGIRF